MVWIGKKLKAGLAKTRKGLLSRLEDILPRGRRVDNELLEDLEDVLLGADVGLAATDEILDRIKEKAKGSLSGEDVREILRDELLDILAVHRKGSPGAAGEETVGVTGPGNRAASERGPADVTVDGAHAAHDEAPTRFPSERSAGVPGDGLPGGSDQQGPRESHTRENLNRPLGWTEPKAAEKPEVILVVGVNGAGKTTTVGKLAWRLSERGKSVMVAASDTFRAGATEQLDQWIKRTGGDIVRQERGADPAAVAFDALQAAKARSCDYLLVDTAGRLHTKANLMEELKKIGRVLGRLSPGAPHRVLLVLDATAGQNALVQAREFGEATGVTGIVMAKLDGTARGGAVIAVARELSVPVEMLGVGEGPEDLEEFDPEAFVDALLAP